MKLRGHGRPTAVQKLTRARITDTIPPYARVLTGIGLFRELSRRLRRKQRYLSWLKKKTLV